MRNPALVTQTARGEHADMNQSEFRIPTYPWIPDQGDGTYCNPILCADYSDPDVIRHGDDFWLTASSFNCTPCLPILHSHDLVNWTIVNYAVKNVPDPRFAKVQPGEGVWAPAIREHAGKFYLFFPTPDEGIYVCTADDPAGKWSEPHMLQAGKGLIDPCPLWDDDGNAYLVHAYAKSRSGIKNVLRVRPMAPDASKLLGDGKVVFEDPVKQPTLEGPKFLKKDGYYYISAPAGGVGTGWQVIFRSKNVYGPYESKIVLARGSTPINGPHQGALVDLANGDWWFVHFQELLPYGRIVHLEPVKWQDGWPLIGVNRNKDGVSEPVGRYKKPDVWKQYPIATPQTSDEFDGDSLGLQWQWWANHRDEWHSLTARKGHLRLNSQFVADGQLAKAPNLLLQKLPARIFSVTTSVELTADCEAEFAGLVVMGKEHAAAAVRKKDRAGALVWIVNGKETEIARIAAPSARLKLDMRDGGQCTFAYDAGDGKWHEIAEHFRAVEGVWIGAKVGLFSVSSSDSGCNGHADFDYFRFDKGQ